MQGGANACLAAPALELGRDYARVVEYQHVAGSEDLGQIEHAAISQARPFDEEHARRVARARGTKGDAVGRKVEVEKVDAHYWGCGDSCAAGPSTGAGEA